MITRKAALGHAACVDALEKCVFVIHLRIERPSTCSNSPAGWALLENVDGVTAAEPLSKGF